MGRTLIVPGLHGSGPDHWQSWWERQDPQARRVGQQHWDKPDLRRWAGQVRRGIDASAGPVWLVAHSFGCLASVRAGVDRPNRVAGALLVAPADPEKFGLTERLPQSPLPFPSIVVASTSDPWLRFVRAAYWANRWGSCLLNLGDVGHINPASGFGPWPAGMELLRELQSAHGDWPQGEIPGPLTT